MQIAVVIPCYRVRRAIDGVLERIGDDVDRIYVVDDACPEGTGDHVESTCRDPRVRVLRNEVNLGVGGAMRRGYREALHDGMDVVVKMDGDGQMDPTMLPSLVRPILNGEADYAKGNRLAAFAQIRARTRREMPAVRWFGNSVLSFAHKAVSGYWPIVDPTNGYTAIHRHALAGIDLDDVSNGYFFETDMLFQLNLLNAVVRDVAMPSIYGDHPSSLSVPRVVRDFPPRMARRLFQRILHKYFVYDFNVASVALLAGLLLLGFGVVFGAIRWIVGVERGEANTAGTVMLSALPVILGVQLLLTAISYDVDNVPKTPLLKLEEEMSRDAVREAGARG